jgi:hypothetical protein
MRGIVVRARASYDATVPYRRYVIVGVVLLAAVLYAGKEWNERDEPPFELTPEMVEAIQEQADDPAVQAWLRRADVEPGGDPRPLGSAGSGSGSQQPTPRARYVEVTLDPSGRPYDRSLDKEGSIDRRRLTVLHAPSRRVVFLGGEHVPWVKPGEIEPVLLAERPGRRYRVDAIWRTERLGTKLYEDIVGVVIVERDTRVERWRELQRVGYGTDAGLGAITTVEWPARGAEHPDEAERMYETLFDMHGPFRVADADGNAGTDTVVFSNGFGDGGFPAVAGYDAAGRRAQIVLWTIVAPWRLAFPVGIPPPQVTQREEELIDCLAGRRTVDDGARCRVSRR